MAINSGGGGGGGSKRQRVDGPDDRCEAAGSPSDAIPVDRISALPDELRLHILTHLPLKDAIRTGALARGWRDLWKRRWAHRASLKMYLGSRDDLRRQLDALARKPRPRRRLERFSLIVDTSYLNSSEFQRFLDYATECGVEDLHVEGQTPKTKLKFHLPLSSPALACLSLRDITVSMFYKGTQRPFHALEVIRLVSVSFRPEAFTKMMALCPSLITLDLCRCRLKELHLLMLETKAVDLANLYLFLKTFQCPNLERLFVQLPTYRLKPTEGSIDQVHEEPPEDGLDNLVMVKVMNFNWCPTEVQLVSFLLRKASSLQKLLIVSGNVTPVDSAGTPEEDLLLLKEALVNGTIMFTESNNTATQPYHKAY